MLVGCRALDTLHWASLCTKYACLQQLQRQGRCWSQTPATSHLAFIGILLCWTSFRGRLVWNSSPFTHMPPAETASTSVRISIYRFQGQEADTPTNSSPAEPGKQRNHFRLTEIMQAVRVAPNGKLCNFQVGLLDMMGRQSLKGQATLPHAQLMSYPQASAPLAVLLIASKHSPRPASAVSKIGIVLFSRRPVGRPYGRARMIQHPRAQTWLGPISACGQNGYEGTIRTNLMGMGKEKSASCARLHCLCGTLTTRPIQAAF